MQRNSYCVERLRTVSRRIPQLRLSDREFSGRVRAEKNIPFRTQHFSCAAEPFRSAACIFYLRFEGQGHTAFSMVLPYIYAVYAGLIISGYPYRSEYAASRKPRTPVPAEHAVSLSEIRKSAHGIFRSLKSLLFVSAVYILRRRPEQDAETVAFALQALFDVILPGPVHIICRTEKNAVEPYLS